VDAALGYTQRLEQRLEEVGEGRLPYPAQAQRADRYAQLADREVGIELVRSLLDQPRRGHTLPHEPVHLRGPDLYQSELGSHKQAVQSDQEEREDQREAVEGQSVHDTLPECAAIVSGHTVGGELLDASLRVAQNRVQHLETKAKTLCRSGVLSPWLGFRGGHVGVLQHVASFHALG
jgi:hypothetical protein